jgi:alkylation response protein AidB-like acyl-CoA dehydrogenase
MDFSFNPDQEELRGFLRAFLERHATSRQVREAAEDDGFAAAQWRRLTGEMELTGLAIDADRGGAGASFVEVGIALEELGRTLLPVPYLPTVVAAAVLGEASGGAGDDLLERIAGGAPAAVALGAGSELAGAPAGEAILVEGSVAQVVEGARAELLVLAVELEGEPALVAVEAGVPGLEVEPLMTLDQTRRQAGVRLADVPARRLSAPGAGAEAVARARDLLGVALAAESVGAAASCLEATIAYLGERVQFGRPIGSFQALKHRCADLAAELEAARSTAYYATWAVDGARHELPVVAPLARAVCGAAFVRIAAESIQLHGGIGFTWEHDAHLYLKRAKAGELLAGGFRGQRRLAAERAGVLAR